MESILQKRKAGVISKTIKANVSHQNIATDNDSQSTKNQYAEVLNVIRSDPFVNQLAITEDITVVEELYEQNPDPRTNQISIYLDDGDAIYQYEHCKAKIWFPERLKRASTKSNSIFSMCYCHGKVQVQNFKDTPIELQKLWFNKDFPYFKSFHKNIRSYNNMFCFTSMRGQINHDLNNGGGPYTFVLTGQNYHRLGSLVPLLGASPVYSQLYIYDTDNEITNRINTVSKNSRQDKLDPFIVSYIKQILDSKNALVKKYRMARDVLKDFLEAEVKIALIRQDNIQARNYSLPVTSKVAALVVGDFDENNKKHDIIVEKYGQLKRIDEIHKSYLPLLFPFGDNGYSPHIQRSEENVANTLKKKTLSIREYLCYRLMDRDNEISLLLHGGKLLQ
ncbi:uncharacterized protein LOC129318368 [Prosopis cineraria]|uniref:uncharacterized protein LOC129318368 n=1 Tax=Prosopis cineraria TaxID=364024 RepID=UPI00240F3EEC|nr:uncharacterized protein LOC129318368 [Prosopis cineraria]